MARATGEGLQERVERAVADAELILHAAEYIMQDPSGDRTKVIAGFEALIKQQQRVLLDVYIMLTEQA